MKQYSSKRIAMHVAQDMADSAGNAAVLQQGGWYVAVDDADQVEDLESRGWTLVALMDDATVTR